MKDKVGLKRFRIMGICSNMSSLQNNATHIARAHDDVRGSVPGKISRDFARVNLLGVVVVRCSIVSMHFSVVPNTMAKNTPINTASIHSGAT